MLPNEWHIKWQGDSYIRKHWSECVYLLQYNAKPVNARDSMDTEIWKALQHAKVCKLYNNTLLQTIPL